MRACRSATHDVLLGLLGPSQPPIRSPVGGSLDSWVTGTVTRVPESAVSVVRPASPATQSQQRGVTVVRGWEKSTSPTSTQDPDSSFCGSWSDDKVMQPLVVVSNAR